MWFEEGLGHKEKCVDICDGRLVFLNDIGRFPLKLSYGEGVWYISITQMTNRFNCSYFRTNHLFCNYFRTNHLERDEMQ